MSRRRPPLPLLAAVLCGLVGGPVACAGDDEDTLQPFEVSLTTMSDCSQVGQGAVNCTDESALRALTTTARWVIDYRGPDTFVLLTDTGRTLPGVYFANDGRVQTRSCTGEGGTCHFSRTRFAGEDPQSGCPRQLQRVVDLRTVDGELVGEASDVSFTEEGCESSLVRELLIEVTGVAVDEAVPARETFKEP